jgi:8-oxo-dGTP pyrophosphatase MutT (NUDIX family)
MNADTTVPWGAIRGTLDRPAEEEDGDEDGVRAGVRRRKRSSAGGSECGCERFSPWPNDGIPGSAPQHADCYVCGGGRPESQGARQKTGPTWSGGDWAKFFRGRTLSAALGEESEKKDEERKVVREKCAVAAFLFLPGRRRMLVTKRVKEDLWFIPAGKVEPEDGDPTDEESWVRAGEREVEEETGIDGPRGLRRVGPPVARSGNGYTGRVQDVTGLVSDDEVRGLRLNHEHDDWAVVSIGELELAGRTGSFRGKGFFGGGHQFVTRMLEARENLRRAESSGPPQGSQ